MSRARLALLLLLVLALVGAACSGASSRSPGASTPVTAASVQASATDTGEDGEAGESEDATSDGETEPAIDETDAGALPAATAEADLELSMLTVDDIGEGAETTGFSVLDAQDIPAASAFEGSNGIRAASQTIRPADGSEVTEHRWQFPSTEDATAFLEAADQTLAQAAGAGEPAENLEPVGDTGNVFFSETEGVRDYAFVFTVGNFAAVVRAKGPSMTDERAQIIAQAAAQRMQAAVDGGLPEE